MQAPTEYQWLDLAIKGVGGVGALIGVLFTLVKYFREKRKENETAKIESQKPFLIKRQEVYFDLLTASASIAAESQHDAHRQEAEDRFWQLYWGAFQVVKNKKVSIAAEEFVDVLNNKPLDAKRLKDASVDLARACRTSLSQSWDKGLSIRRQSGDSTSIGNPEEDDF
jgi:hypothetical protein